MAPPPPSKQCWDKETLLGQGTVYRGVCTNYNIAWGRGGKGGKLGQIVLIVLRILSSVVSINWRK